MFKDDAEKDAQCQEQDRKDFQIFKKELTALREGIEVDAPVDGKCGIDAVVEKCNKVELKMRDMEMKKFPTYFIRKSKIDNARKELQEGERLFACFLCFDGFYLVDVTSKELQVTPPMKVKNHELGERYEVNYSIDWQKDGGKHYAYTATTTEEISEIMKNFQCKAKERRNKNR